MNALAYMKSENFASYEMGTFTIDCGNMRMSNIGLPININDLPAFVHEWWHYIQDVSTLSGRNGFYCWMRDLALLTKETCSNVNQTIHIPLKSTNPFSKYVDGYQRLSSIYFGDFHVEQIENPIMTKDCVINKKNIKNIEYDQRTFAECTCYINNRELEFNIFALQEINAWYAQKLTENIFLNQDFSVKAEDLPSYPYSMGDVFFNYYKITTDIQTKFIITYLCLDTMQPVAIFVELLTLLKGKTIYFKEIQDRVKILNAYNIAEFKNAHPKKEAYNTMNTDYINWLNDKGHEPLHQALSWYINTIMCIDVKKQQEGISIFPESLTDYNNLLKMYKSFPISQIKCNNQLYHTSYNQVANQAVLSIWMLKRITKFLSIKSKKQLKENSKCPFYEFCTYKSVLNKEYDCAEFYLNILQGEKESKCPFGVVLGTVGLWQNHVEVDIDALED